METTNREKRVVGYYVLCNKLKSLIRKGWLDWNVNKERIESVAEHIYSTQQLAIIMQNVYHYNVDLTKVIMMLAVHEMEEIIIDDKTKYDIDKEEKTRLGHAAVEEIVSEFGIKQSIKDLIMEFDERKTDEAKFAYMCDKLECDLQCKMYDEDNCVDLNNQSNNALTNKLVNNILAEGKNWSEMWMEVGRRSYPYDKNFRSVSEYAENNDMHDNKKLIKQIKNKILDR